MWYICGLFVFLYRNKKIKFIGMSVTISFYTLAGRKFENIPFDIDGFFDYMHRCGIEGINPQNQIILFLHNLFESELAHQPYDSISELKFEYTQNFLDRYEMMDSVLRYNL